MLRESSSRMLSWTSSAQCRSRALLDVRLQSTKGGFVSLHGQLQNVYQAFRSIHTGDNPLLDHDRPHGHSGWLEVQSKIDEELFGRSHQTTEIGVAGCHLRVINMDFCRSIGERW